MHRNTLRGIQFCTVGQLNTASEDPNDFCSKYVLNKLDTCQVECSLHRNCVTYRLNVGNEFFLFKRHGFSRHFCSMLDKKQGNILKWTVTSIFARVLNLILVLTWFHDMEWSHSRLYLGNGAGPFNSFHAHEADQVVFSTSPFVTTIHVLSNVSLHIYIYIYLSYLYISIHMNKDSTIVLYFKNLPINAWSPPTYHL